MRIKAFTLIELIVVIVLIGIVFSLALNSYMSKEKKEKLYSLKDLTFYIQKNTTLANGTFFIYGDLCQNAVFRTSNLQDIQAPNFGFTNQYKVVKENILERFVLVDFESNRFKEKKEKTCFALSYKNGRFFDKYIINTNNISFVLSPFEQSIEGFETLELAQKAYMKNDLYPSNIDDYYEK